MEAKTRANLAQLHDFCPFFMNQIGQPRVQVWVKGKKAKACLGILQPMVDNPGRNLHIEIIRSSMISGLTLLFAPTRIASLPVVSYRGREFGVLHDISIASSFRGLGCAVYDSPNLQHCAGRTS